MDEIKVTFPGGKRVIADIKGFSISTDQPVYAGGEGTDPAPFDLFLASLATCAGFYVITFCQSRGIPTENASVVMTLGKNAETRMIDRIKFTLQLPQEFPEKYIKAVEKSVDQCAVKRHILNPPSFDIETKIG